MRMAETRGPAKGRWRCLPGRAVGGTGRCRLALGKGMSRCPSLNRLLGNPCWKMELIRAGQGMKNKGGGDKTALWDYGGRQCRVRLFGVEGEWIRSSLGVLHIQHHSMIPRYVDTGV